MIAGHIGSYSNLNEFLCESVPLIEAWSMKWKWDFYLKDGITTLEEL